MRCVMSKLAAGGRITVDQFTTARQWNALSQAYRSIVSGSSCPRDADAQTTDRRLSTARLDRRERQVIRRYRTLAPILGPLERAIVEGRGRYPRTLAELASVRRALDEIASRWVEAGS